MDWYRWHFMLYKQDTMHLDPYQDGCYRRLLDHYMETRSPLPDNDHALARIIGDSFENWTTKAAIVVRAFFKPDGKGNLSHKRCNKELDGQDGLTKVLSESGKKGAETRKRNALINKDNLSPPSSPPDSPPKGGVQAEERRGEERKGLSNLDKHPDNKITSGTRVLKNASPPKNGSRIPDDWVLTEDLGKWAEVQGLSGQEVLREAEKFKNYWISKTGKNATKLNWDAAWRSWIFNAMEYRK